MPDDPTQLVMIDATDALAHVFIRPPAEGKTGVRIDADSPGLDRRAAAQVLQHLAARWAPPVDDDGEPITGATGLRHEQSIDHLRAIVAGAAQWAEGRQPRSSLVDHVAMTNSYALAAVLGMLLATDPALAYRAALLVEGVQVDGDVAYLDDLDHGDIVEQAEGWARLEQVWGRAPAPTVAQALHNTTLIGPDWPCPTCGSPARHLHPSTPTRGGQRAYASLDTGEVVKVCPDPWHTQPGDPVAQLAQQALDREHYDGPCHDPQCNDSTWDHPCPVPPPSRAGA